ncbi:MAG: hypothetical protein BJ554DRAFT_3085 [Olpidium bornovanus]|uniref:Uncharacterized protein n=1 Tax=Olpidium bornovanus TaxID=278681 RepID=A0A8H7ZPS7_9FUNG|nr:MAG: hypothetical protein BJ554DRAFT_3085 [Olpidium bornovanus]
MRYDDLNLAARPQLNWGRKSPSEWLAGTADEADWRKRRGGEGEGEGKSEEVAGMGLRKEEENEN